MIDCADCSNRPLFMSRPSESWTRRIDLWNDFIQKIGCSRFAKIKPQEVASLASEIRGGLNCTLSPFFKCGSENAVFEVVFPDDVWICRVHSQSTDQTDIYI